MGKTQQLEDYKLSSNSCTVCLSTSN